MRLVFRCHISACACFVYFRRIVLVVVVGYDDSAGGVGLDLVHGVDIVSEFVDDDNLVEPAIGAATGNLSGAVAV